MADESDITKAERAYADAAAKSSPPKSEVSTPKVAAKADPAPAAKIEATPAAEAPKAAAPDKTVSENPAKIKAAAKPAPAPAKAARKAIAKKKPAMKKASVKKAAPKPKPVAAKPAVSVPAAETEAKPILFTRKKPAATIAPATPSAPTQSVTGPTIIELKEKIMATVKKAPDLTNIVSEIKDKAKAAYDKSSSLVGEMGEFTKGNVEAMVESGKIFASGAQEISREYVEESKSAFETITTDLKKIAAVKSPTEFFQLQGELARRNFDSAIAFGSKSSEKIVKLSNESFAPISNRVSVAVEKISKTAA